MILNENKDKINWKNLSKNPYAIEILKDNIDKINWNNLSSNESIFRYKDKYEIHKELFE